MVTFFPRTETVTVCREIFGGGDSLRGGYKGFDDWYNTASAEQRKAWIVELEGKLAGVCIYKKEMVEEFSGLGVPNLKLCTFKVDEFVRGGKLGELLLKQAFMYSAKNGMKSTWLTAFPRHEYLVSFIKDFGFQVHKQFKINKETGDHHHKLLSPDRFCASFAALGLCFFQRISCIIDTVAPVGSTRMAWGLSITT